MNDAIGQRTKQRTKYVPSLKDSSETQFKITATIHKAGVHFEQI
jgi:hypothetical protein